MVMSLSVIKGLCGHFQVSKGYVMSLSAGKPPFQLLSSSVYQGGRESEIFNNIKHNVCFVCYNILTTFWIHRSYANIYRYVCESNKRAYKYM